MGTGEWNSAARSGVQLRVNDALDTELDAYLDRELSSQPASSLSSSQEVARSAERLQGVLALATEEEQWLRSLPPEQSAESAKELASQEVAIPEHLKAKPAPEQPSPLTPVPVPTEPQQLVITYVPLLPTQPGLMTIPVPEQPWNAPVTPAPARRGRWLAAGAVVGVSTGVLAAGLLWMMRAPLPEAAEVTQAHLSQVSVTAAALSPVRAPERGLLVESSPLQRSPQPLVADWSAAGSLPGPVVPGQTMATQASQPAVVAVASEPKPAPVAAPGRWRSR